MPSTIIRPILDYLLDISRYLSTIEQLTLA